MGEDIRRALGEEILRQFEKLSSMPEGEAKEKALNNLLKLLKIQVEEEKMEAEADDIYRKQDSAEEERKAKNRDQVVNRILQLLGIVMPFAGTIVMAIIWRQSFKEGLFFEENGITTSTFFKENLKHMPKM